jgi:manganese transport protein
VTFRSAIAVNRVAIDGLRGPLLRGAPASDGFAARHAVAVPAFSTKSSALRRALSFAGPGYLVAVGYVDPGNWATSLTGGSNFGYSLLSVILLSNAMAMLLQAAAVRLGVASGLDLAQSCRRHFSPCVSVALWIGCEIAVIACNLAELLGMACGLGLLFDIPLVIGVGIAALDVFLILLLQRRGVRYLEAVIIGLVAIIGACFAAQLWWLHPPMGAVAAGFLPSTQIAARPEMLYLAVGIVGATVMPHNLYLHSAIVQTRMHDRCEAGIRQAIRYATVDSNLALGIALILNAGILVLAAGAFHHPGQLPALEFEDAYRLLSPSLGVAAASTLFGIGLIASGLSSSITGTLAGQIVMEGFLDIRVSRAKRALLTRCLAILPAVAVTAWFGTARMGAILVLTQVILGLQLPFAVVPLLWFTTRRRHLGVHAFRPITGLLLWSIAIVLVVINSWVVYKLT